MSSTECVTLTRETEASLIPSGARTVLPTGTVVRITQSLGGTYTVMFDGGMARWLLLWKRPGHSCPDATEELPGLWNVSTDTDRINHRASGLRRPGTRDSFCLPEPTGRTL